MANYEIPQAPAFNTKIRKFEITDPGHADILNDVAQKLFDNEIYLKKEAADSTAAHVAKKDNPHAVTALQIGLENVNNTADINKPISTTQQQALDTAYANGNAYTDKKIGDLVGGAPSTLDTLKEISDAFTTNKTVVDALDAAIGTKANQTEMDTHTANTTVHITASERTKWNTVDAALSATSVNPVQNKAVQEALTAQNSNFTQSIAGLNNSLNGCWISFTDAAGNPTTEPYIHWETEVTI